MKNQETITIEQKLSVEELEKATKQLVDTLKELKVVEAEQKDYNKILADRKKSLNAIIDIRGEEALTAIRKTEISVTKRINTQTNEFEYVDVETEEIVKREPFLLPPAPLFDGSIEDVKALFSNRETGIFEELA